MSLRRSSNNSIPGNGIGGACTAKPYDKCKYRPIAEPSTGPQVVLMIIMYMCRRVLFYNAAYKIAVYIALLFLGSLLCDFFPLPRNYFSQKGNVFNVYFVKLGWGWTLVFVGTFILLSSYVYCCGERSSVRRHLFRLVIATVLWYVTTSVFNYVESATGTCTVNPAKFTDRVTCVRNGHRWYGFDISGHAFLLIFCSLIIMEESRSIKGWERIGEMIQQYEFDDDSPLKNLNEQQLGELKVSYGCLSLYVKLSFVAITLLGLLWDFMLVCTTLYFHSMVQKVVGGLVAVLLWFITYQVWYPVTMPGMPGDGPFRYAHVKSRVPMTRLQRNARNAQ